jgi:hypothetical protein
MHCNSIYDVFNVSCACLLLFSALCNTSNATANWISLLTAFSEFWVSPHVVATVGCVQLLVTSRHDVCTLCTLLPKVCPMFHCERFLMNKSSTSRRVRLVLSETTHSHKHKHKHTHTHTLSHSHTLTQLITAIVSELFQLTHDSGKKQKKLDKYPMLSTQFWAPDDGRRNSLKHVEHL